MSKIHNAVKEEQIAVVGMGYVGLSIASVLARRGVRVFGVDLREDLVAMINSGVCPIREPGLDDLVQRVTAKGKLTSHTSASVVADCRVMILAVGTPLDEKYRPDTRQLMSAVDVLLPFLKKGQCMIIKSTVPPGTTRELAAYIEAKSGLKPGQDIALGCCPERLAEGNMIHDIESIPVVVGGFTPDNTEEIAGFWSRLGWSVIPVSGPEEAEMIKLADNLWIDLNIALANELCLICHRLNIDVLEVINGANSLPKGNGKVNILLPGPGVGGSCLVKDPWFLHQLGEQQGIPMNLPSAGRKSNEWMPGFVAGVITEELKIRGKGIKGTPIAVLGLAFKQNTGDTRFSPSWDLIKELSVQGAVIRAFDPWVEAGQAEQLLKGRARVEKDLKSAVEGCDAVVFMVGHPEFLMDAPYWRALLDSRCLMVDCRYLFNPAEMVKAGLQYVAPGRRKAKT